MLMMKWPSIIWPLNEVLAAVLYADFANQKNISSRYFMTNNSLSVPYEK